MAQTTILAAGTTEATSTDVVLLDDSNVILGLFMATSGDIPLADTVPLAQIVLDNPGTIDTPFFTFTSKTMTQIVNAPKGSGGLTARVVRNPLPAGVSVGVFKNQA